MRSSVVSQRLDMWSRGAFVGVMEESVSRQRSVRRRGSGGDKRGRDPKPRDTVSKTQRYSFQNPVSPFLCSPGAFADSSLEHSPVAGAFTDSPVQ